MVYIKTIIATSPINPARNAHDKALSPSVGLIFSSCIRINGAGNVHSFSALDNSFADSAVNHPFISAVPPHIFV
jgi:hypothetical protein